MRVKNKLGEKYQPVVQRLERVLNSILLLRLLPITLEVCEGPPGMDGQCVWKLFFFRVPRVFRHALEDHSFEELVHISLHEIAHALDLVTLSQAKREAHADRFSAWIMKQLRKKQLL